MKSEFAFGNREHMLFEFIERAEITEILMSSHESNKSQANSPKEQIESENIAQEDYYLLIITKYRNCSFDSGVSNNVQRNFWSRV